MEEKLTICSVYHSLESKLLLELNWDFVRRLNPNKQFLWMVADNTPEGYTDKVDEKQFIVVPGADRVDPVPFWLEGSYRHARATNSTLRYVKTRFVVFLDTDFYIALPKWMDEIVEYMVDNNFCLFGVPWHPAHFKKYRYFPCHHALFVDLGRISVASLDFMPKYDRMLRRLLTWKIGRKIRKIVKEMGIGERINIGRSRDTGYAIYQRYHNRSQINYECPQPVFLLHTDLPAYLFIHSRWNQILEALLPDRFCYVPKRREYYVESCFRELGYYDARARGWEEFMWRGKPFGFHLRGSHKLRENLELGIGQVKAALDSFAS